MLVNYCKVAVATPCVVITLIHIEKYSKIEQFSGAIG